MADLNQILDDLAAEHAALDSVVAELTAEQWDLMTLAEGWSIKDQISHIAFFDERAAEAASDASAFMAGVAEAAADPGAYMEGALGRDREGPPLDWWREARTQMIEVFRPMDVKARIPWYGPPMSTASFATARLMETWAHGQDVIDALGVSREPTDRLRHIAHLGVRTRNFSFVNRGLPEPEGDVRVELLAPSGEVWVWGAEQDASRIAGTALDFCLVVAQRRHIDDTDLVVEGDAAGEWMRVAQAFAGPPGAGREPQEK
ncbi:MAG: TIGR03084 family protein [Acidobacteria bacterium]|nr:MAG: TIGR03084 family protein [Acidobacteriota bacterium]